jgi:hypothetical protein
MHWSDFLKGQWRTCVGNQPGLSAVRYRRARTQLRQVRFRPQTAHQRPPPHKRSSPPMFFLALERDYGNNAFFRCGPKE